MQSVSTSYLQDNVLSVVCDPEKRLKRVPIATLQTFQGALKTLDDVQYDRLRVSLIEEGFAAPVFTWHLHDKVLDGHQRLLVCEREGWSIEGGVPVVEIEAVDEQEAARKLPRVYAAAYETDSQDWDFGNAMAAVDLFGLMDNFDVAALDDAVPVFDVPSPDFDISLFEIIIDCDNEAHQAVLLERFLTMDLQCRALKIREINKDGDRYNH